jgi:hypothetical protein
MTPKQRFLQSITDEINALQRMISNLQSGYEAAKRMPDSVFESMGTQMNGNPVDSPKEVRNFIHDTEDAALDDTFGNRRKIVAQIIADNGRAMSKSEIIKELKRREPNIEFVESVVRNSLSALRSRKVVRHHKPPGVRMKGGLWSIADWWDGDRLPVHYLPKFSASDRYLK